MKWSYVSPYFHLSVWLFSLTLLSVWLWELRARNVTPKNIPATFLLMTVSLALALLNSCMFLFFGSSNEMHLGVGRANTHQWMCALCGIIAIVGQYLVRVSVWAFFIVRGSLVTSFHPRLNQIARATPYVLSAHAFLFVVLCALFVDIGKGSHSDHSEMCHVRDFPLWLLFVGPMAGDLFYGFGFFVIFYSTMRSSFLQTMKSLSMRERMATQRHLRRNLVLFMLQLLSAIGTYVLILSMNFSFTSFELAEMNAAITNMCLFALFRGRVKVYTCCSRVLCPEIHENLVRHDEVQCELRCDEAKKRRAANAIEAFRKKEKHMEAKRKSVDLCVGDAHLYDDDYDSVEESVDLVVISNNVKRLSVPILGDDRVFCNRWSAVHSRMGTAMGMLPITDIAAALGTTIAIGLTPPPSPIPRTPIVATERLRGSSNPESKPTTAGRQRGLSKHTRAATAASPATISTKADKLLGVSEALAFTMHSTFAGKLKLSTIISTPSISMESSSIVSNVDYNECEWQSSEQSSSYDDDSLEDDSLRKTTSMPPPPKKSPPVTTIAVIPPASMPTTAVGGHSTMVTSLISTPISMESSMLSVDSSYVSQVSIIVDQSSSFDDSEDADGSSYEFACGHGGDSDLGTAQSLLSSASTKKKAVSSFDPISATTSLPDSKDWQQTEESPKRRSSLSTMSLTSSIKSKLATSSSFKEMFQKVKALRGKRVSDSGSVPMADGSHDALEIEPLSPVSGNDYEEEYVE